MDVSLSHNLGLMNKSVVGFHYKILWDELKIFKDKLTHLPL